MIDTGSFGGSDMSQVLNCFLIVAMSMIDPFVAPIIFPTEGERGDMVGSGAVVPCEDHPSPALRTVRAACHRTRLALYVFLE